ncbi:hypothetical protein AB1207_24205 [Kineococcus endophyticus]|uniref:Homeodomain-like domain-containing protein n=1 Tax=Kineococcus endophyticus TaxID=1181883 RepID=A0ABV3PDY5_9ACTN
MPHKQTRDSAKSMADALPPDPAVVEARQLRIELAELTERADRLRERRAVLVEELRAQGHGWAVIAALFGIAVQRVYQIAGLDRRDSVRRGA